MWCRWFLALPFLLVSISGTFASEFSETSQGVLAEIERQALAGNVAAQTYLGLAHDLGDGLPQDAAAAARWYRMAAEQGNADAQFFLGGAHLLGRGVPQDPASALRWLDLAATGLTGEDKITCERLLDEALWQASPDQSTKAQRLSSNSRQLQYTEPNPVGTLSKQSWARRLRYQANLSN